MLGRLWPLLVGGATAWSLASGCELFHSTDWPTACDLDAGAPGCPEVSASSTGAGHATSSGSGGAGGGSGGGSSGGGGGVPRDGTTSARAALSCDALVKGGYDKGSRVYWLDVDGDGPFAPFTVYCEVVAGVGWTLAGIVSAEDGNSWLPAAWSDVSIFGVSSASVFTADMKNTAWLGLASKDLRFENETGGLKTATLGAAATMKATFGAATLVELAGMQSGWTYTASNDANFFAEIQNPPSTVGKNLAQRNACVLTMGYDDYINPSMVEDDQVQGFGCVGGSGGGSGACGNTSCGDVIRDASLMIFVR